MTFKKYSQQRTGQGIPVPGTPWTAPVVTPTPGKRKPRSRQTPRKITAARRASLLGATYYGPKEKHIATHTPAFSSPLDDSGKRRLPLPVFAVSGQHPIELIPELSSNLYTLYPKATYETRWSHVPLNVVILLAHQAKLWDRPLVNQLMACNGLGRRFMVGGYSVITSYAPRPTVACSSEVGGIQ